MRTRRTIPRLLLLLASALCCQPVSSTFEKSATRAAQPVPPNLLAGAHEDDPWVFPPPARPRDQRQPMPAYWGLGADDSAAPRVAYPYLGSDEARHFTFAGRELRIRFDQAMERPRVGAGSTHVRAAEGTLRIEPPVVGEAEWVDDRTLVFTAAQAFDPEQTHELTLGALKAENGASLAPWSASFEASIAVEIAGKIIDYLPEPNKPRVVAVTPADGRKVSSDTRIEVLYDQPVDLDFARAHVQLRSVPIAGEGKVLPVALAHPKRDRWGDAEVDARHVIVVRPDERLRRGESYLLAASHHADAGVGEAAPATFAVADRLALESVDCGWGYDPGACDFSGGVLTSDGREFSMVFNNQVSGASERLLAGIEISPKVRNLGVYGGWDDGRVYVYGEFKPSTVYRVHVTKLRDVHGGGLAEPVDFRIVTRARPASASIPEGRLMLDSRTTRAFPVATRNVDTMNVELWPVGEGGLAWPDARRAVADGKRPETPAPLLVPVRPASRRDQVVETALDLGRHLEVGRSYVATVSVVKTRYGAEVLEYPEWSEAGRPAVALLTPGDAKSLAIHARYLPEATLVHVAKLESGEPVAGAELSIAGRDEVIRADAQGFAELPRSFVGGGGLLTAVSGGRRAELEIGTQGHSTATLTPGMQDGDDAATSPLRGMVLTDRGIYRPGSRVEMRGTVRLVRGATLLPAPATTVHLRVLGPTDEQLRDDILITDDMGSVVAGFDVPSSAAIGRHRIVLETHGDGRRLAEEVVQVAAFERPRFTVDVEARQTGSRTSPQLSARVVGRYLFGAGMGGAEVNWTLRRRDAELPANALSAAGFEFTAERPWWLEDRDPEWARAGSGVLGAEGALALEQHLDLADAVGPQRFELEAEVSDTSHRAIAGRSSVVVHPAERYAGLVLDRPWFDVGAPISFRSGVVDREGKVVDGARVTVELERVDWRSTKKRGPGGSVSWEWREAYTRVGSCTLQSAGDRASCPLRAPRGGEYRLSTIVDGRAGGRRSLYAWWGEEDGESIAMGGPQRGHRVELVADKAGYAAGETAKVLVRSPFAQATAIFTVEQGGLLQRKVETIKGAGLFELPITLAHAPRVHVTVTLLPRGASGATRADWRFGAVALPVDLAGARLDVAVASDRADYRPGGQAKVKVTVQDQGRPVAGSEVALAIVDEGVLRLTNFHATDPVSSLRPARGLRYWIRDTRDELAAALELSHVAGDGLGSASQTVTDTRQDFVETLTWQPSLRTGEDGSVEVSVPLSDDLTRFRMMAVVVDRQGKGGRAEADFTVSKPVMVVPAVPRFAVVGDQVEMAAVLHNNTDLPLAATVSISVAKKLEKRAVQVPARGSQRVGFARTVEDAADIELEFAVADARGAVLDKVRSRVAVQVPGIDEHPFLAGSFAGEREVVLAIPADVSAPPFGDDFVDLDVGQKLSPNFLERLRFLLDYPHGCVEQTTSSTLPLIAARDILPHLGDDGMSREELDERILAGLVRLDSMRTSSGGLAYWPGEGSPNVYGTAYAIRAVLRAEALGIHAPDGLLAGMADYLAAQLFASDTPAEVRAAIAQSLAELGKLPASAADPLWDGRSEMGVFGKSSLALALSHLDGQVERTDELLDEVVARHDARGRSNYEFTSSGFSYYGSLERDRAQAAIALTRLRPQLPLLAAMQRDLGSALPRYTTQASAYELLAIAESLGSPSADPVEFEVFLDGAKLAPVSTTRGGVARYRLALSELRGAEHRLRLAGPADESVQFSLRSQWRRHGSQGRVGTVGEQGPSMHRVYTQVSGDPVDLASIRAGEVLRVVVYASIPDSVDSQRMGYLAVTDRLPAGFEAIQPDLATVSTAANLSDRHPLHGLLEEGSGGASHFEMRDDRVDFYFDEFWRRELVATYLVRATTPGTFMAPAPIGELMYEVDGIGYGMPEKVVVR